MNEAEDDLLAEQAAYYRARAGEYDDWWQRRGRYDRGAQATVRWNAEVAKVERWLASLGLADDVLELACGTGWWTERLACNALTLTCLDASPETIAVNRARIRAAGLPEPAYEVADLFAGQPVRQFDTVFFSFWLSHVPEERFESFWVAVARALRPGGRAVFIDSAPEETSTARDHVMPDDAGVQERLLNDGRRFRVLKRFHAPDQLSATLADLGWRAEVHATDAYFIYGSACPS